MALDEIINSIVEGGVEQILLYIPILIIGIGCFVLIIFYLKDHWKAFADKISKLKKQPSKPKQPDNRAKKKPGVDYKKEVEEITAKKNPTDAMDELLGLINKYFSQLLDMHYTFTYEELIEKLEKEKKVRLEGFCEKLLQIEFSKDEVTRKELKDIASEFLKIMKEYPLKKGEQPSKNLLERIKIFNKLKRFTGELKKDLEKEKTVVDKFSKAIGKTSKTIWDSTKDYFASTKTPRKVSFHKVLKDAEERKRKPFFERIFHEEKPTIEGFFYFLYLLVRKKITEKKKMDKLNDLIKRGQKMLKGEEISRARAIYNSIIPLYNSLAPKNKRKMLPRIVKLYLEISKNYKKARSKKKLKLNIPKNKGGKKNAKSRYKKNKKISKNNR